MEISEIFTSIQGEGNLLGRSVIFLRLSKCNFHCPDCDSKYSWDEGIKISVEDITTKLTKMIKIHQPHQPHPYICITGGEPLLQSQELEKLILSLPNNYIWSVETNGSIGTRIIADPTRDIQFTISPKLPSFYEKGLELYDPFWSKEAQETDDIIFKFVIGDEQDLTDMENFITEQDISRHKVWLMPKCITVEEHLRLLPMLWKYTVKCGLNLSARLQVLTFNNRRGV